MDTPTRTGRCSECEGEGKLALIERPPKTARQAGLWHLTGHVVLCHQCQGTRLDGVELGGQG